MAREVTSCGLGRSRLRVPSAVTGACTCTWPPLLLLDDIHHHGRDLMRWMASKVNSLDCGSCFLDQKWVDRFDLHLLLDRHQNIDDVPRLSISTALIRSLPEGHQHLSSERMKARSRLTLVGLPVLELTISRSPGRS